MNDPIPDPAIETRASRPTVDELFDVLREPRRRRILSILRDRDGPVDVRVLARAVAASERDVAPSELSESTTRSVHVTLHHVHLPKLDEAGFVDHVREERTVATSDGPDEVPIPVD